MNSSDEIYEKGFKDGHLEGYMSGAKENKTQHTLVSDEAVSAFYIILIVVSFLACLVLEAMGYV